jgi:hypothetical protein
MKRSLEFRLKQKIEIKLNGCWEWKGYRGPKGYGEIQINHEKVRTHRLSFLIYKGEIPEGQIIMHLCDNPPCLNPDHLKLGTIRENNLDSYKKGRSKRKLKVENVLEIKQSKFVNRYAIIRFAEKFNVKEKTVQKVLNGETWKII